MRYSFLLASAALAAAPSAAGAACEPVFRGGDQSVTITGVEIEPNGNASENFEVRVGNDGAGSERCSAVIRVSRVGAVPDPNLPAFALQAPGNSNIEVLPAAVAGATLNSDVQIGNAPQGPQGAAVRFSVDFPTEWGLRSGTYTEQLLLSLYDATGTLRDTATVTMRITIPSVVALRLVGAVSGIGGGPARVDLGNLSPTSETRSDPFAALVLSTSPYNVSFTSANQGRLLQRDGSAQIPYQLYFDGQLVSLTGLNRFNYARHTPSTGDFRRIQVVVPPVTALAGSYSDRVTVTLTAM